jgi:hypothetical protein
MWLPKPSILERYTNIFFVFTLSGILHVFFDIVCGKVDSKINTMLFFQSFALGIMLEDGVQGIWRRLTGAKFQSDGGTSAWKKAIGFIWVSVFFVIVSPWFGYAMARIPFEHRAFGPVTVTEKLGIQYTALAVALGLVPLWLAFKSEP